MGSEEEFFNKIICVNKGYSDCDSDEDESEVTAQTIKSNKKITTAQTRIMLSRMEGRFDGLAKGKTKSTVEQAKMLDEWNVLSSELNAIGPPQHSTSKWRRVWTKMKSRRNKQSPSVLLTRGENKSVDGAYFWC